MRNDTLSLVSTPMCILIGAFSHRTHTYTCYLRNISPLRIKTGCHAFSGLENPDLNGHLALASPVPDDRVLLCQPHWR